MTHADDEGMVVPPKLAPYQIVIVPVIKDKSKTDEVMAYAESLYKKLSTKTYDGEKLRVKFDKRDKESLDKGWEWTRKGAPLIVEVGLRDIEKNGLMLKTRIKINTPEFKQFPSVDDFVETIEQRLTNIQQEMYQTAHNRLYGNIRTDITTPEELRAYFANSNACLTGDNKDVAFIRGKWCEDPQTEAILKEMKITIRCIPEDQTNTEGVCLLTGKKATLDVIYARSY
jgi:prolyl-tRNA synthetase